MECDIQEKLKEIYTFSIEVEWVQFRQYKIICNVYGKTIKIYYTYDNKITTEYNIKSIELKIDAEILKIFKKEVII